MTRTTAPHDSILEQVLLALCGAGEPYMAIARALDALGSGYVATHAFVNANDSADAIAWCASGATSDPDRAHRLAQLIVDAPSALPRDAQGLFVCEDIARLSKAKQALLSAGDAKALLLCPLCIEGRCYGALGLTDDAKARAWTEGEKRTFLTVAQLIAAVLRRAETGADVSDDFLAAMNGSPANVMLIDPADYRILHFNRAIRESYGAPKPDQTCHHFFFDRDKPCDQCPIANCDADCRPLAVELPRRDGSWILSQAAPLRWHGRDMMMVTYLDITRQKAVEAELLNKTLALDSLVQATPGGIFQYSAEADEQFVFISENMLSLLGYTHDEFVQKFDNRFSLMIYEKDRERVLREIDDQIAVTDFDYCEYRIEAKNGELKWVHDVGHIVTDPTGKRWFYVVIVDITRQKQIEEALRERNEENQIVISQSGNSILRYDVPRRVMHNPPEVSQLFGVPEVMKDYPESMIRTGCVLPESEDEFRRLYQRAQDGVAHGHHDIHLRLTDGTQRWYHAEYTLITDADGKPSHAIVSIYDDTERIEKIINYQKLRSELNTLANNCVLYQEVNLSTDTVERLECPGNEASAQQAAALTRTECTRAYAETNLLPESRAEFLTFFDSARLLALFSTGCEEDTLTFLTGGGESDPPRWHTASVRMASVPDSADVKAFIVINNVDQEYRERMRLEQMAYRDSMTQLLNHETTEQRIRQALLNAAPENACALFMIDLDNFKSVNDTLGHQAGDDALKRIAEALADSFRQEDIVGRFGGDEFMAFIASGANPRLASRKAAKLVESIQFSFGDVVVTVSVGVAIGAGNAKSFEQLYAEADAALYRAKADGKGRYCLHSSILAGDPGAKDEQDDNASAVSIQLKTLLENMDGGIVLASVAGGVQLTYVSPSYYSMMRQHGHAVESNVNPFALVHQEDMHLVQDALRKAAAGTVTDCVYRLAGKDGEWQQLHAAPIAYPADEAPSAIAILTDITGFKQSEERYHIAENKYRLASELSKALIWEVDLATRTLYQSVETSVQLGHSGSVFPNVPDSMLSTGTIHPDSVGDFRQMYADLYAGIEGKEYTILCQNSDATYTWVRASFRYLRDGMGTPVRSIGIVEKMPNVNAEMRAFRNELRFMDLTAHTLMGTVRLNLTQNLVEKCAMPGCVHNATEEDAAPLAVDSLNVPDDAVFSGLMKRGSLLGLYQEGQTWLFRDYERDDGSWINLAINLLRHPISGDVFAFGYYRSIDGRRHWEEGLPAGSIERDSSTLLYTRDTLAAIFNAAMKHLDAGAQTSLMVFELSDLVQLKASAGVHVIQRLLFLIGRVCRIVIEGDVAIGHLDETHIAFFHENASSPEQERDRMERYRERIGMLLRQVMPDIELKVCCGFVISNCADFGTMVHQAEIACASSRQWPGNPVIAYSDPQIRVQDDAPAVLSSTEETRILLVDDDPVTLHVLRNILEKEYFVTTAADGALALAALHEQAFDLVISDIMMPNLTGWELMEAMRQEPKLSGVPVVIVTSDSKSESEVKALTMGASDVIVKPFVARTLKSRVSNIIGRYRAVRIAEENRLYEQRFQQQSDLLRFAEHDELTGLYNRHAFYRHVRERLDANPHVRYMMIRWDLDNFKMLNDVMGVETGDRLLKDLARALCNLCSPESVYARLEADHFVDFLPADREAAESIFQRVLDWFADYPLSFRLTSRIGVYYIDEPSVDVSIMCDRALMALRSIKGSFNQRVAYYNDDLRARIINEQELSGEMLPALHNRQFQVYFQPQYNYATGELTGAEALVRWNHPHRGLIPPNDFIPLFERNGFISLLDEFVWEESCRYMRRWLDEKDKLLPVAVAVNISRIDIYNPRLCEKLQSLVARYQLPASYLRLEITESAYMQDPQRLIDTVKALRAKGFTVEMDDFGSGYSSLTTLKDVPVDILKLDMRFLSGSEDDVRAGSILSSVIRMAHWLKLPVLAEGVETRAQAEYLKNLNCVLMQGYLFGKPMPAAVFERLLDRSRIGQADRFASADLGNMDSFWDASAQTTLVFNSLIGGACILDYAADTVEIVRANDDFFRELNATRADCYDLLTRPLDALTSAGQKAFRAAVEAAIQSGERQECELACKPARRGESPLWLACTVRVLSRLEERCSVFASVRNISRQKRIESAEKAQAKALRAEIQRNRLLLQYLNTLVFKYDFQTDTLQYEVSQPGKGVVSREVEKYLDYLPRSTVIHPDYILPYRQVYYEASKAPIRGTFEYVADNFGTGYRWCRAHYTSVANDQGQVYCIVGIVYDIQGEKDAEKLAARDAEGDAQPNDAAPPTAEASPDVEVLPNAATRRKPSRRTSPTNQP